MTRADHDAMGAPVASGAGIRVLVLCADIGQGHVSVARTLAAGLRERNGVQAVELCTDLEVMGERFGRFLNRGFHLHLDRIGSSRRRLQRLSYELAYKLFFELGAPRRAAHLALAALGARGLRRTIGDFRADVVVTEYPVLSAALGQLRSMRRLAVPVCSSISDPAGLWYWAHPGIDLHLLSWPESLAEVERIAGRASAVVVRPLIDPRFFDVPTRGAARAALDLPAGSPVVVVSGGGWAVGDLDGAVDVALAAVPDSVVICVCGHRKRLRQRLEGTYGGDSRVRVLGFTARMPELLAAADALIHTTGGTTALEARVVGCRLVNYGTAVAHVRAHARALQAQGVAHWAPTRSRLAAILPAVLAQGRPPPLGIDGLPDAANMVLQLVREARGGAGERRTIAPPRPTRRQQRPTT